MHRKRLKNLKRVECRNQLSIETYVNSLFDQHAKLLVIRLDIGYRKTYYDQLTLNHVTDDLRFTFVEYRTNILHW